MLRQSGEIAPDRVAIYIRWSTDDQGEGTTPAVQLEGCRHYLLSQGWVFDPRLVFSDDGWSGADLDRPALQELRGAIREGRVDCVVVFKLDRLSRTVPDMINLVLREWDGICHVKSARENLDTTSQQGKMFFYLLASFAEWERATIRDRTFSGKLKRAQEGRNPGYRAPYGYRWSGVKQLEIVPAEAEVVHTIYREYLAGRGISGICHRLNVEGPRFRGSRDWSDSTIKAILSRPVYKGTWRYGWRQANPRRQIRQGEPWYLKDVELLVSRENVVPVIITPDQWESVQALKRSRDMVSRRQPGRVLASRWLLTGLARCRCGHSLYVEPKRGKVTRDYYCCMGRKKKGSAVCRSGGVPVETLDSLVMERIKCQYGPALHQEQYQARWIEHLDQRLREVRLALATADRELAGMADQERHLRGLVRTARLSPEEYRSLHGDLAQERNALVRRRESVQASLRQVQAARAQQARTQDLSARLEVWAALEPAERKWIVRELVAAVVTAREPGSPGIEVQITFKTQAAGQTPPAGD